MTDFHLAQLNVAKMKFSQTSAQMSDFVANIDRINSLAEIAPGYIWRSQSTDDNVLVEKLFGSNYLVTMSVWKDVKSLQHYVYHSEHAKIMSNRNKWFERMESAYYVLWWLPAGKTPTFFEAKEKLVLLQENGPTSNAFTFKKAFPTPNILNGMVR